MDEAPSAPDAIWSHRGVRAAAVACGAALLYLGLAVLGSVLFGRGFAEEGATVWFVLAGMLLLGALVRRPLSAGGLVWLGVQSCILAGGFAYGTDPGLGPFLWFATAGGFVAGFAAFAGSWLRHAFGSLGTPTHSP